MGIRAAAKVAEDAAVGLADKGRGLFGRRERQAEKIIGQFVGYALTVPPGGVLPHDVRETLHDTIERTINALETYVARTGKRSSRRNMHDTGVVQQVYALRDVEQHLLHTRHFSLQPGRIK